MSSSSPTKGELKKDASKSTAEGEWEMRDGKWYRRDYYSMEKKEKPKEVIKCQVCPTYVEKISLLTKEITELKAFLSERDRLIADLRARLERYEIESKTWISDRRTLEQRIRELEALLRERSDWVSRTILIEKETLIVQLNARIQELLAERDANAARILKLTETIETLEKQFTVCKARGFPCNNKEESRAISVPIQLPQRWYYAVQDVRFRQLFSQTAQYQGGDIVIDPLEGATVVNPEYYSQSENVPGTARLRIRVVDFVAVGSTFAPGTELFVRLKLGEAAQFSQARPFQLSTVAWHQDLVFIEVPLKPHPTDPASSCSVHPLVIEIVSRVIGTVQESVVGSAQCDLTDLVVGLTRISALNLTSGGVLNIRVKALDFGLPQGTQQTQMFQQVIMPAPMPVPMAYNPVQSYTTVQRTVTTSSELASTPLP